MDTRAKVVNTAQAAVLTGPLVIVSGPFDVLTAAAVLRLRAIARENPGHRLVIAISTPDRPVLESRARAELVAALGVVDYVFISEGQLPPAARIVREETIQDVERAALIEHVHRRQNG
ncbi:MAG: hypothetical protein ACRD96_25255 [Bryobacteraceae bacterium]